MTTKDEKNSSVRLIDIGLAGFFFLASVLFCRVMGYSMVVPLFLTLLGVHLWRYRALRTKDFLNIGLLLTIIIFITHIVHVYAPVQIPYYYIPAASIAMLAMLLFKDIHLVMVINLAASFLVGTILSADLGVMITFFMGGLVGGYFVRNARTRGDLITAGLFVSSVQLLSVLLLKPFDPLYLTRSFAVEYLYPLAANGFISALTVVATLKIFEFLFGVLTNFSLLELSDFNHPLLKRMILEAPGTYHHSLVVSNLAEAAADAIGADALLTRVGGYYHDIGKMGKSEYFTENQIAMGNKHDHIEPSMSRLVILNHVKEGVELAKKHNLDQAIIDFIPQHHGTSLIYFFYQRSLEEAEEGETINPEDYRYPGPKPQSRETAITLLADSVEGAVRSLDEHDPNNIKETVHKVINNKFIDGQLDECPLTLKEINTISETFIRILSAMYHSRVKYPESKEAALRHAKSATSQKKNNSAEGIHGNHGQRPSEKNKDQFPPGHSVGHTDPSI